MTFIKYTHDGKAVIQPAALTLSNLDNEDTLEMHTLDNAIVLLKEDMAPMEKYLAIASLARLVESLAVDLEADTEDGAVNDSDEEDDDTGDACDDRIAIPIEAFEDAGIWGEDIEILSFKGGVLLVPEVHAESIVQAMHDHKMKRCVEAAALLRMMDKILATGDADA